MTTPVNCDQVAWMLAAIDRFLPPQAVNEACAPLLAEIDRLKAQVAELQKDAARLKASEANLWFVEPQYDTGKWRVGKANKQGQAAHAGKTLREAIDNAMKEKKE